MEQSLLIIKPDGVGQKVAGDIIRRMESEPMTLIALKMMRPSRTIIEQFYAVHRGKPFYEPLVRFMTSGPIIAGVWEGEGVIARIRGIIGATNSKEAAPGTLRNLYGTDNRRNVVHASDSAENAQTEIACLFKPDERIQYDPQEWKNY